MAGDRLTAVRADWAATSVVDAYLEEVAGRLTGPLPARAAILTELHDGLLEAVDAHRSRGLPVAAAAGQAVAEFGDPRIVAGALGPELAALQSRRIALTLVRTGPLVGALWLTALTVSAAPPWQHEVTGFWLAATMLGLAIAVAGCAALLTVAATGRLSRWLPIAPRVVPAAAAAASGICAVADVTFLVVAALWAVGAPGSPAWAPLGVAVTASVVRIALTGRAARRSLITRSALSDAPFPPP